MTREEAKELLLHILMTYEPKDQYGDYDDPEPYEQALTMAIEALSADATIGDYPNDLIGRSALMEYCSNQKSKRIDNNDIARFPSADADCSTCKHKDKDWDSEECDSCCGNNNHYASADAESDDLIIKGAKGIQDGLYNIKDGKLFKYKGKGGTVRTYPIVPSAEAGWIPCSERLPEFPFISCDAHGNIHIPQGIFTFEDSRGIWCIDDVYGDKKTLHYGNRIIAWMPLPKPYREDGE